MVTFFLPSVQRSDELAVGDSWGESPGVSPITNKYVVYTPMDGSPTIRVMIYAHYGGASKLNRNTIL